MTDFRGLGFDPVPGNPDTAAEAARRCTGTAARLREIQPPGDIPEWAGLTATPDVTDTADDLGRTDD
ncbi:hypothetical protein [Amycolatopsis eburnea]|uniref:Uncharacterized protein n=1 Tax=Amycolatopsis eburnea TaxID=2267691 RepID=A0A3R9FQK8_9PSEU|nr:hypothetical protein [Amycolatopsis eburnea]RSD21366.1 hypothetical protein EIY87_10990 [Amycolatopsis eburnea]